MSLGMQEILPSGGLANFQNHVSQLADLGRYEDAYIAHLAEGETVVPMDVLNSNPHLKAMLFAQMRDMGIDPQRYIVGSEFNSINPVTGQPEFFLKKIFKSAKKTVKKLAPYAGLIAGAMGAGPMYSALAGGIGGLYGSGGDFGAGAMGALGGYGAGKAFGTSSWVPGTSAADANYVFGGGQGFEGSLGRMGENLGFGGPKSAGVDTEIAAKVGAPAGTTVEEIIAAGGEPYEKYSRLVEHGIIKNPASKMTNWEKGILFGLPIVGGLSGLFGDDEVQGPGSGWEDIHAKNPWYGRFGNPVLSAEGGMIKNFDNGGDTTLTTQQQLELEHLVNDRDWSYEDAYDYVISLDLNAGGIVSLANGGSPRDVHPGMDEGYQFDFDVDGENRTYSFDEQGLTDEARQEFLAREGITPIAGGIAGAGVGMSGEMSELLGGIAGAGVGMSGKMSGMVMRLAKAMKTFGTVEADDVRRAMEMLKLAETDDRWKEEIKSMIVRSEQAFREGITPDTKLADDDRARVLEILQTGDPEMINAMMERAERNRQIINEFRNIGEEGSPHDYTEDKYADGGIAHLAGGSFPRMTGAIAGPGGPRDDMVPAMLSDGEFVMTAEAVRNAGGGNRRAGAKRMYELMNNLEQGAV